MVILHTAGLLIYGAPVARMLTFLFLLLLAVGVYSMTRRFFHRKIALFATALTITTPFIFRLYLMDHPFSGCVFYAFMALYSFIIWYKSSDIKAEKPDNILMVSGIFTGLSLSFGMYGLFVPLVMLVMVFGRIISSGETGDVHEAVSKMMLYLLPFLAVIVPMMIKNVIITGSPLFPFFSTDYYREVYRALSGIKGMWGNFFALWYVPFEGDMSLDNFYYLGLGYILFLPALLLVQEIGKTIRVLMAYLGLYLFVYLLAGRRLVLLYSVLPVLGIVIAYIIVNLYGQKRYLYHFVMALFFVSIAVNFYSVWPWISAERAADYMLGYNTKEVYLSENVDGYGVMRYINEKLPAGAVVLTVGEDRTFYIDREVFAADKLSEEPLVWAADKAAGDYLLFRNGFLKENGITHLLVRKPAVWAMKRYRSDYWDEDVRSIYDYIIGNSKRVYDSKEYSLYEF